MYNTGELHYIPSGPDAFVNLPREGGVAYAAQESWVQNDTIRVRQLPHCMRHWHLTQLQNNILFGAPYDQVRYDKGEQRVYTSLCGFSYA